MTQLTTKQIEEAIVYNWLGDMSRYTIIPHLGFGLLNHEADLAIIDQRGCLTEIEIKRSLADLRADFKKDVFHCDEHVYRFWYCLPLAIKDKAYEVFDQHQDKINKLLGVKEYRRPAVLLFDEAGNITCEGDARTSGRKLTLEERVTALRLMSIKYWDLRMRENG